jgi:hypothetical protein
MFALTEVSFCMNVAAIEATALIEKFINAQKTLFIQNKYVF